jgi:hypothetical protein
MLAQGNGETAIYKEVKYKTFCFLNIFDPKNVENDLAV